MSLYPSRRSVEALYDILPHLSVIRSRSFRQPVEKLLESSNRDKKQFAVIALGILGGNLRFSLVGLARKIKDWQGPGIRFIGRTLIAALGESAVPLRYRPLLEIFRFKRRHRDLFAAERRLAVITALATLVQQGVEEAQEKLTGIAAAQLAGSPCSGCNRTWLCLLASGSAGTRKDPGSSLNLLEGSSPSGSAGGPNLVRGLGDAGQRHGARSLGRPLTSRFSKFLALQLID